MPHDSLFAGISFDELLLLGRHVSRVSGFISLKILGEYLPGVDIGTHVQILESLIRSRHIQRVTRGYYTFVPSDFEVEAEEVESEQRAIANLKTLLIHGNEKYAAKSRNLVRNEEPEANQTLKPSDEKSRNVSSTESRSFYAEKLQNLSLDETATSENNTSRGRHRSSTHQTSRGPLPLKLGSSTAAEVELQSSSTSLGHQSESFRDMSYTTDMTACDVASAKTFLFTPPEDLLHQESRFEEFGEEIAATKSDASTVPLDPGAPEFMPSSFPVESSTVPSAMEPQEVSGAVGQRETPKAHVDLLPPPRKPRSVTFSAEATSSPSPLGHTKRGEAVNKFQWTKKKTGEEVDDPCGALEIFCRYNGLRPPSYSVIFMPRDNVYFCKLIVGTASFKSYPAMSLTKKRAMEVAAERAVESLGLTASTIAKLAKDPNRASNLKEISQ